jgi:NTP pyrophosphatase (non-canonical NTP hydrolase)
MAYGREDFPSLSFDEYLFKALKTASYPDLGKNLIYPALSLCGEAGEVAEKIKKLWRNKGITSGENLSPEEKAALELELGDILWYIAAMCFELGLSLEYIAMRNLIKLEDRKERGVIKSEGDNR